MAYTFIDTTETSDGFILPSEAMQINGEYIENLISGYRTLSVSGREALSPELVSFAVGKKDGSTLQNKRYPERVITVKYQLVCASNEEFRNAYNQLGKILNVEDAELIFNDETDKYFVGTPAEIGAVNPGANSVIGEFTILCTDPFKYSVLEYEAEPDLDEGSFLLDYNGTYKCYPTLEAEFYKENEASDDGETEIALAGRGDCGYVAFFNENEKIIQLGDPDEENLDTTAYPSSQTLVNQEFVNSTSWGTAAQKNWAVNSGITSSSAFVQAGSLKMGAASYDYPKQLTTTKTILSKKSDYGNPYINYKVVATSKRITASTASVTFTITASLATKDSFFGGGYALNCNIEANGKYYSLPFKTGLDYWKGTTGHTKSLTINLTGLSSSASSLKNISFWATRPDPTGGTAGILQPTTCSSVTIPEYLPSQITSYYLCANSYGSGSDWHGASITRTIPADETGAVGATNFTLTYHQKMCIGSDSNATNQYGAFQAFVISGSGASRKYLAGVGILKNKAGKKAVLRFYLNGKSVKDIEIDLSYNNTTFDGSKATTITKSGNAVTFNVCGYKYTFKDDDISDVAATQIEFMFSASGTKSSLSYNGLYWAKFVKNNCKTWKDIPNKFSANDILKADCKTGKIYLNGVERAELGALGNDWEGFYLTPGLNQIGFAYSEWVNADCAPTLKVKYREVFL